MSEKLLLGVDGGGTRCRVRIRTLDGQLVGEAEGGSANIFTDPVAARGMIIATAERALAAGGLATHQLADCYAGLGLAGANLAATAQNFAELSFPFACFVLKSDAITACLGAHGGADGGIAILGTGSAYVARIDGQDKIFGGWGFTVSDGGGGADLGRAALVAALLGHDGMGPETPFTSAVLAQFKGGAAELAAFAGSAKPVDFGRFCPLVWHYAEGDDPVALAIVQQRIREIEAGLQRLLAMGAPRLSLLGGQAARYAERLGPALRHHIHPAQADALEGALALARQAI